LLPLKTPVKVDPHSRALPYLRVLLLQCSGRSAPRFCSRFPLPVARPSSVRLRHRDGQPLNHFHEPTMLFAGVGVGAAGTGTTGALPAGEDGTGNPARMHPADPAAVPFVAVENTGQVAPSLESVTVSFVSYVLQWQLEGLRPVFCSRFLCRCRRHRPSASFVTVRPLNHFHEPTMLLHGGC